MPVLDRHDVALRSRAGERFKFELGCGPRKQDPQSIGVDMLAAPGVDMVGEVFEVLDTLPDGCASAVYSAHFFEHIADLPRLLQEVARVLAPGARLTVVVPHFSNPFYYSDPTHRTPFGLYTMAYFCAQGIFTRSIPIYGMSVPLTMRSAELEFKSYPPRYGRHAFKRLVGALVNSSMYMRELYEENLCWLVPCYQVRYELVRDGTQAAQP
jgi:hypothetical protein